MNTGNRRLFIIACYILLITGCSNEPSIKSATADKVIISGPPEMFTPAYELANKECEKNTKTAQYIQDHSTSLKEVAFNCVGPETEEATVEAATDTDTEEDPKNEAPEE